MRNQPFVLAARTFHLLNALVPKRANQVCLHSFPNYEDMTRGLLQQIIENCSELELVILTHHYSSNEPINIPGWAVHSRVRHYAKRSVRGLWAYFRSKYVFFTHSCFSWAKPVRKQICVNVWHGMPIKSIGRYKFADYEPLHCSYLLSTSPFFSKIMAYAFSMPEDRVLEVGLPRNDILLRQLDPILKNQLCDATKLIVWLPTFRHSELGGIMLDGKVGKNIFNLPDLDITDLDTSFREMDMTVLVKPHPLARKQQENFDQASLSNIQLIDEAWLTRYGMTLYQLLSLSDMLITDISSVLVDYLILNRPIICHFPDMEEYKNSRGLIWDFDPRQYGIRLVCEQAELIQAVNENIRNFGKPQLYPELQNLMHAQKMDFSQSLFAKLKLEQNSRP